MTSFPTLFSPTRIGRLALKNRLFFPAHSTSLGEQREFGPRLQAYYLARAGAGLIITEPVSVHETHNYVHTISAMDDGCIENFRALADNLHARDCKVFVQFLHAGRAVRYSQDGSHPVSYAPSSVPDERVWNIPMPLTRQQIRDIITAHGEAAARLDKAGIDGVEIGASMGYLIAQFLNPNLNLRNDEYGGSFDNRMRFLREIIEAVRSAVSDDFVVGIRISADEIDEDGLHPEDTLAICERLDRDKLVDFIDVTIGSTSTKASWAQVYPHMVYPTALTAQHAETIKNLVNCPVLVAGRINTPRLAEDVLARGQADMCGMVRAMICDPAIPEKCQAGQPENVRGCIGCNQACVGHRMSLYPVSCIQHPESGRELEFGAISRTSTPKTVMVVGGGPAGMKAAAAAAERGHKVTLYEQSDRLGGQAQLAQLLPGRADFGGLITNLSRELELSGARICCNHAVDMEFIGEQAPDLVILATGSTPVPVNAERVEGAHVLDAQQVISGDANVGGSVLVSDWRCDWVALGVAEKLARDGCHVRLATTGAMPGERIQYTVREYAIGELHRLGVEMLPYARFYGADQDTVYLQHILSGEAQVVTDVDTLILAHAYTQNAWLAEQAEASGLRCIRIGDCLSPRTAEEAVLEGLRAAASI